MPISKLKRKLKEKDEFPCLITDLKNIKYLTGFSGSNGYVIVGKKKNYFISDSRYELYAKSILKKNFRFVLQGDSLSESIKECLKEEGAKTLFLESHDLSLQQFLILKKKLRGVKMVPLEEDCVNSIRMIKTDDEIDILRRAAKITDDCVTHLTKLVKAGMTELDVATEIEYFYRKRGCSGCSFDSIVASGPGAAMPHYMPGKKKIKKGECLLIDMGCTLEGYNSDLTRTFFIDSVDVKLNGIYNTVKEAQQMALDAVKAGITTRKLDGVARNHIAESGYGDCYNHGLGHGLGLDVHELPALKRDGDLKLKNNMVITIEPGIYIPDLGGVRIEDMVLVTRTGCEVMTKSSRELIVI